jgi:hypothetical protein
LSVFEPKKASATFGGTFTITMVIACILGVSLCVTTSNVLLTCC